MATTQKTTKTANAVDTLILAAGKASGTMYAKAKEAAKEAAKELDTKLGKAERIAAVVTAHAEAFTKAGHNVKAIFVDALTLYAFAGTSVTITGPKNSEATMSASKAVETLAKNPMREAAKQVRAEHGLGRKTTPKVVASTKIDDAALQTETLAEVASLMHDANFVSRLLSIVRSAGYVVEEKAIMVQTPKMARAPKMADVPSTIVKGAAQSAVQAAPF